MKPYERLGEALTPNGTRIVLYRHDGAYLIRADGVELMSARRHQSEDRLAEVACAPYRDTPRARVLIPAITFVATAAAVVRAGYEPVLSDVDERTWLLTPEIARRAIAKIPVDAVMPVSTYGCLQDTGAWDDFSRATGVPVVIDAAGAFGNQQAGERSTLVFSLHATKVLSGAEGGFEIGRASCRERV